MNQEHGDLLAGKWWACHYPERPIDGLTAFLVGCQGCGVAFQMASRTQPDQPFAFRGVGIHHTVSDWETATRLWNDYSEKLESGEII